jgi:ATP-dependent protease HslVU (ClpYQ) peptidase subunit
MTCIVGLVDKETGTIWMGGDSQTCTNGGLKFEKDDPKVFKISNFIIGCAGPSRLSNILRYGFEFPEFENHFDFKTYLIRDFIPEFICYLREIEFLNEDKELPDGGNILIGFNGQIKEIGSNFGIHGEATDYISIGSGNRFAYGSFYTTESLAKMYFGLEKMNQFRIQLALEAAAKFNCYCGKPFCIEKLEAIKE